MTLVLLHSQRVDICLFQTFISELPVSSFRGVFTLMSIKSDDGVLCRETGRESGTTCLIWFYGVCWDESAKSTNLVVLPR